MIYTQKGEHYKYIKNELQEKPSYTVLSDMFEQVIKSEVHTYVDFSFRCTTIFVVGVMFHKFLEPAYVEDQPCTFLAFQCYFWGWGHVQKLLWDLM